MTHATLVNILTTTPEQQPALIALLRQNMEQVIWHQPGWRQTELVASEDGATVIIHSEWDRPEDIAAMRADPRMQAYFPRILALATFATVSGRVVAAERAGQAA